MRGSVVQISSPLRRPSMIDVASNGAPPGPVGDVVRERIANRLRRSSLGVVDGELLVATQLSSEVCDWNTVLPQYCKTTTALNTIRISM